MGSPKSCAAQAERVTLRARAAPLTPRDPIGARAAGT